MGYLSKYSGREVELILDNAIFDAPNDGKAYIRKNQDWETVENLDNIYSEEQALETFYTKELIDDKLEETSNAVLEEITKISDNLDSEIGSVNKELISINQELTNTNNKIEQQNDSILKMLPELNNVIITTQDDYDVMETYRQNCFYVCIKNDEIVKIYLGKYIT